MRSFKLCFVTIMLLCLMSACVKEVNDLKISISPSDKALSELASTHYSRSQLMEIIQIDESIDNLNKKYPIECMRETGGNYRVSYLGESCVAVILFDKNGNRMLGNLYDTAQSKSDFSPLEKGSLLGDVQKIDPNGEYLFLYTGRNDIPKTSTHYTVDGYLITIEYDEVNVISGITEELI